MTGAKLLSKYLREHKKTAGEFAREAGVAHVMVWRWLNDPTRRPGLDNAQRIDALTKGAVPASAWARKGRKPHRAA